MSRGRRADVALGGAVVAACAVCCAVPLLALLGVVGVASAVAAVAVPVFAAVPVAAAGTAWLLRRRARARCGGGQS